MFLGSTHALRPPPKIDPKTWHDLSVSGVYSCVAGHFQISINLISVPLLAVALCGRMLGSEPTGRIPVLISHACSPLELANRGDGIWYFIKYRLDHRGSVNNVSGLSEEGLRQAVTAVMARRVERLVYVAADPHLPYGDVLNLLSELKHDDSSLHVVLLTEKQTGSFIAFKWERFSSFCLRWPQN